MGSLNLGSAEQDYYIPARVDTENVLDQELHDFLQLETVPIFSDEKLTWSDEFLSFKVQG